VTFTARREGLSKIASASCLIKILSLCEDVYPCMRVFSCWISLARAG